MSRAGRLLVSAVLACLVLLGAVTPAIGATAAPAVSGTASQQPAPDASAVQDYSSCLGSTGSGDLLLLIDESGSLTGSDPQAARVTAARYLLSRLATFADRTGTRLNVAIAAFAGDYTPAAGWTPLGAASLPGLNGVVDSFATRNKGTETDYWTALENARRALVDQARAAAGGPATARRCQAIAWFSDGELDITPHAAGPGSTKPYSPEPITSEDAATRAEAAATDALCRPRGGLADQLRATGTSVFGIGLDTGGRPRDFDLMRAISTGTSPTRPCGTPSARPAGDFQLTSGIDDLLFAFDYLVPPTPPISQRRTICPGAVCGSERHAFVLDPSAAGAEVLGSVDRDGVDAVLVPPSGPPIPLGPKTPGGPPGTASAGPATVTWTWLSERTVSVELTSSARGAGWSGEWALAFVDRAATAPGGNSRTNVHITGELAPAWTDRPPVLHSGDVVPATFGLVDSRGTPVAGASVLGTATLGATLLASGRPDTTVVSGVDKSRIGTPARLDLRDVRPGPATLRLVLDVRTAQATRADGSQAPGTSLAPRVVELPLQIAPPTGYPQPDEAVDFGTSNGETELTAGLGVTGPGCVWVPPDSGATLTAEPQDAGGVRVAATDATSPQTCLRLGPGERGELRLRLSTAEPGNGAVAGTIPVLVAPPNEPQSARPVQVVLTADLRKPLDQGIYWLTFLITLLLGIGIPIGLLYLAKRWTARIPARSLTATLVPVTVTDREVYRDGQPFHLPQERNPLMVPVPGRGRQELVAHGVWLRPRIGWSPLAPPYVLAGAYDPRLRAAADHRPPSRGTRACLPTAVHGTWVVLHDPSGPPDQAAVLALVPGDDPTGKTREQLAKAVRDRLPGVLAELRAAHPPAEPSRPPDPPTGPFGGPPPPPPPGPGPGSPFDFGPHPHGGPSDPSTRPTGGGRR